jgi:hypothetical protein
LGAVFLGAEDQDPVVIKKAARHTHQGNVMTRLVHSQMLTALGFAALLSMSAAARADSHDGRHDFDFTFGTWTEHSRRLLHPLSGSNEWMEWDGRTVVRKIWDGRANMAEFKGVTPSGQLELIALRVYNPTSRQWSLNFATSKVGKLGDAPGVGEFKDGRIDFYDQEPLNGLTWATVGPRRCRRAKILPTHARCLRTVGSRRCTAGPHRTSRS